MNGTILIKIGGSTLGRHDTTLADVAALHERGRAVIVVHGGGPLVSEWLERMKLATKFEKGLRVTDEASLEVVVAVLSGLVNKRLVAALAAIGVNAVGLSGCDGNILRAQVKDAGLGLVGEITDVDVAPIVRVLLAGGLPVLAPIASDWGEDGPTGQLLNTNADSAAGALGAALKAELTVFMTDVPGVKGADGAVLARVSPSEAKAMIGEGVIEGGMIPKVRACVQASAHGGRAVIIDGREEHALLSLIDGAQTGTVVG
jgi:acetylglutamate kinase